MAAQVAAHLTSTRASSHHTNKVAVLTARSAVMEKTISAAQSEHCRQPSEMHWCSMECSPCMSSAVAHLSAVLRDVIPKPCSDQYCRRMGTASLHDSLFAITAFHLHAHVHTPCSKATPALLSCKGW